MTFQVKWVGKFIHKIFHVQLVVIQYPKTLHFAVLCVRRDIVVIFVKVGFSHGTSDYIILGLVGK